MSYNIACSACAKIVVQGEALSLAAAHRVLDLCDTYAHYVPVTIAVHSSDSQPRNIIQYLPLEDFRFAEDIRHAALVDLDLDDDAEDGEVVDEAEEEGDDEPEQINFSTPKNPKKITIRFENFNT